MDSAGKDACNSGGKESMKKRFERFFRSNSTQALDPPRRGASVLSARAESVLPTSAAPSVTHRVHSHDHHEPRISHRAEVLVEARLDDLAHDQLAGPVLPVSRRRALLTNSWVLLLAAGMLAIIIVSQGRLHVAEALQYVHAVNSAEPYLLPLAPGPINYLYVVFVGAPWYGGPGATAAAAGAHAHRRRLHAADPAAAAAALANAMAPAAGAPLLSDAAAAAHLRGLRSHRVLAAAVAEPETSGGGGGGTPSVYATLMQRNSSFDAAADAAAAGPTPLTPSALATAVVAPQQLGLVAVSPTQTCTLKAGAAARCLLSFTGGSLDSSTFDPSRDTYLVFHMATPGQVAFEVHANELGGLGPAKNWIALAILLIMLAGIASEKVHRMYCAFLGAFAMMGLLLWMNMVPSLETVTEWLDESTLGLLFGMMIIVGQLKNTGLFEVLCSATLKACGGRMWVLSIMMCYLTGFVSAFLDNVTTMLLMGPITISMMTTCNRDPRPLLMAQVLMSNVGGTATMVGDPPNVIIGTALARHLGFVDFIVNLGPGVIMASVPAMLLILGMYRHSLLGAIPSYQECLKATSGYHVTDWNLMAKSGYVTAVVVLGFLLHPVHHVDPAWFAILGAALLCLVVAPMEVDEVMHSVEWDMLLFFAAQFVLVEAASEVGMIDMIGGWLEAAIRSAPPQSRTIVAIEILLWVSAVASGILDNIPYTITMVPVVELLASAGLGLNIKTLAWALAFGACFGGNATLIGASANIVTATMLDKSGHPCTFVAWLKVGVPLMVVTVAAANLYMLRWAF